MTLMDWPYSKNILSPMSATTKSGHYVSWSVLSLWAGRGQAESADESR